MSRTKLLLVDDHAVLRKAMRVLLEQEEDFRVVGEAGTGQEALAAAETLQPDILLLDISLPDLPGPAVARTLLKRKDAPLIIVLTMHEETYYAQDMIRLGVKGFVLKCSTSDELFDAIRTVRDGGTYWDKAVVDAAVLAYTGATGVEGGSGGSGVVPDSLSPREAEVCRLLAYGHTNGEIAKQLSLSIRTVQSHRKNIMGKLDVTSRAELVAYAMKCGLFSPPA